MNFTFGHIDIIDLLVLSYYDRVLCVDEKLNYSICNSIDSPNYRNNLKNMLKSAHNNYFDESILVKLNTDDVKILRQWGQGQLLNKVLPNNNRPNENRSGGAQSDIESRSNLQPSSNVETSLKVETPANIMETIQPTLDLLLQGVDAVSQVKPDLIPIKILIPMITTVINTGLFIDQMIEFKQEFSIQSPYLKSMIELKFTNGPLQVRKDTIDIVKSMVKNGDQNQLDVICKSSNTLLNQIAKIVGQWLGTMKQGDTQMSTQILDIVTNDRPNAYMRVLDIYQQIPLEFQSLLQDPNQLDNYLNNMMGLLEKELTGVNKKSSSFLGFSAGFVKNATSSHQAGSNVLQVMAGKLYRPAIDKINIYFTPNVKKATFVISHLMPLFFSILTLNEYCFDKGKLSDLIPQDLTHGSNKTKK